MFDQIKRNESLVAQQEPPSAFHHQVANELAAPQPPIELRNGAITYVDRLRDDIKANMTPTERQIVRNIERMIVDGDSSALTNYMRDFQGKPTEIERSLNTVVRDMTQIGIEATWNYSPTGKQFRLLDDDYDPKANKDIGHLTLISVNQKAGSFCAVRFSTDGNVQTANNHGGWDRETIPPSEALRTIRDAWIQRTK